MNIFTDPQITPRETALLKVQQNESVSVVIPALNEVKTIGKILREITSELIDKHALVDEVLVVDGGSRDGTREEARACGVRVQDSRRGIGGDSWPDGKGLALWRSQFYTTGTIILFVDADTTNFTASFVTAMAAALLKNTSAGFVKSYYERPFVENGGAVTENGGGRVTELLIRPLFSYFFPEATGFIQPLSGEYGFRRSFLENLVFYTGYGVEIALIIDYITGYGADSIVQVDLGKRFHRNRPLQDLSRMSYSILQTFLDLADKKGAVNPEKLDYRGLRQVVQGAVATDTSLRQEVLPPGRKVQ
jgi:glucosyl-3-phosphoglycerate synthase